MTMQFTCNQCGKSFDREAWMAKRSLLKGAPFYCGRKCYGLSRTKSLTEKSEARRRYRAEYIRKNQVVDFKDLTDSNGWLHPLYSTWYGMKQRCNNPKDPKYKYWGARGISVCERWMNSFKAFVEDMGERPEGTTIDRINNDGNYEPCNCRWASYVEQNRNQRRHGPYGPRLKKHEAQTCT